MNKYRIVTDNFSGYEAQFKRWWCPCWLPCGVINTSATVEMARKVCDRHAGSHVVEEYRPDSTKKETK